MGGWSYPVKGGDAYGKAIETTSGHLERSKIDHNYHKEITAPGKVSGYFS